MRKDVKNGIESDRGKSEKGGERKDQRIREKKKTEGWIKRRVYTRTTWGRE